MDGRPEQNHELEVASETFREWVREACDRVVAHVESLPEQNAGFDPSRALEAARNLVEPVPPEEGRPLSEVLDLVFDECVPQSFNAAGPGYLAYIPGGGILTAALADFISNGLNRYTGVWAAAPLLVELETNVLRWLIREMGYPSTARGIFTTGGSLANLTAITTARVEKLGEDPSRGAVLVGEHAHHSVAKAARICGFRNDQIHAVASDEAFRMDLDDLRRVIVTVRDRGLEPFLVVASAGTTDTGAVDPLPALVEVAGRENMWLHVDAAYGGAFMLTERGRHRLCGISEADSITLDPHKGLFLPYGTGALLVRRGAALRAAHHSEASYMPDFQDELGEDYQPMDFCEYGPELSRSYRGLRLWLPIMLHGMGAFRRNLDEKLDLIALAERELAAMPGIEIVAPPQLSVLAFRLQSQDGDGAAGDRMTEELLRRILSHQRVWLTSTRLRGRFVIRICVLSFRTHEDRMRECLDIIRDEARGLLEGRA
ncbi:MAG TPA: aminotransferase class V-fold PLP-dependent enzyme [Planctomycetes bacterium]|nr:aminotransferase class V-fold PLP-dependent enzyme [Planctomycetota bacterium]